MSTQNAVKVLLLSGTIVLLATQLVFADHSPNWVFERRLATLKDVSGVKLILTLDQRIHPVANKSPRLISKAELRSRIIEKLTQYHIRLIEFDKPIESTEGALWITVQMIPRTSSVDDYATLISIQFMRDVVLWKDADQPHNVRPFCVAPTWEDHLLGYVGASDVSEVQTGVDTLVEEFCKAFAKMNPE